LSPLVYLAIKFVTDFVKHVLDFSHAFGKLIAPDIGYGQVFFYFVQVLFQLVNGVPQLTQKPPSAKKNNTSRSIEENLIVKRHRLTQTQSPQQFSTLVFRQRKGGF